MLLPSSAAARPEALGAQLERSGREGADPLQLVDAGEELTDELLRTAMAYGTALASFNVEAFGTERMQSLTGAEITARVNELQRISAFSPAPLELRA